MLSYFSLEPIGLILHGSLSSFLIQTRQLLITIHSRLLTSWGSLPSWVNPYWIMLYMDYIY